MDRPRGTRSISAEKRRNHWPTDALSDHFRKCLPVGPPRGLQFHGLLSKRPYFSGKRGVHRECRTFGAADRSAAETEYSSARVSGGFFSPRTLGIRDQSTVYRARGNLDPARPDRGGVKIPSVDTRHIGQTTTIRFHGRQRSKIPSKARGTLRRRRASGCKKKSYFNEKSSLLIIDNKKRIP